MDPLPRSSFVGQPATLEGRADAILAVIRDDSVTLRAPILVLRGQRKRESYFLTTSSTFPAPKMLPSLHL